MLRRVPVVVVDVALAAVFVAVNVVEILTRASDGIQAGGTTANLVVLGLFASVLVLRRRAPLLCWLLMHGEFVLSGLLVRHSGFAFGTSLPSCIATYTVARYADRRWARWALLSGPLLWLGALVADGLTSKVLSSIGFFVVSTIAAWGTGRLLGRLAERERELEEARERLLAERGHREQQAVRDERARIALEMQDVVTAAVTAMVDGLQEELRTPRTGEDDRRRLGSARQAGQQALAELHRTTGVLRPDGSEPGPVPTLADADRLLAHYRTAGLDVDWEVEERVRTAGAVPQGVSFAAFRILQEALTNALKHGGGGRVHVRAHRHGDELVLEVRSGLPRTDPAAQLPPSGRHGLVGMRERVAAFGGSLRAGIEDDTFAVRATLPVRADAVA